MIAHSKDSIFVKFVVNKQQEEITAMMQRNGERTAINQSLV